MVRSGDWYGRLPKVMLLGLVFITVPALSLPVTASEAADIPAPLQWTNCSTGDALGLQCAQLRVPLDWSKPKGPQITIGMNRLNATDASKRIGSLVFNPGGPGGAASEFIEGEASGADYFSDDLKQHFDLIGMDPRGVGLSTRIKCDPTLWNRRVSLFPADPASYQRLLAQNKAVGESCLNLTGPLLGHIDTTSAAHDIEAVRIALGGELLNFMGESYGSQLGAAYAELYPQNIRAMALDGIVDHSQSETSNLVTESSAYETEFDRFAQWCAHNTSCALHGKDVGQFFDMLVEQADASPIAAPLCVASEDCRVNVTGQDIRFNLQPAFTYSQNWPGVASLLADAAAGNASLLSSPLAQSTTNGIFAGLAIECLDWTSSSADTFADLRYKEQLGQAISPHTKGASQTWTIQSSCVDWPVPVTNPPHLANVTGAPPILLVNAEHDPETSYVWAVGLLNQIEDAVLLTRKGDGHTSYGLQGQTAAAMDAYLISGTLPAANTVLQS